MTPGSIENLDQVRHAFRMLAAQNYMGCADILDAIELADRALSLGMYTDSIREFAVDCEPKWVESQPQFLRVCEDLGVRFRTLDMAIRFYASDLFRRVAATEMCCLDAIWDLESIMWQAIRECKSGEVKGADDLTELIDTIWLFEELGENNGQRYKRLTGRRAIARLEADTCVLMQQWLVKYGIE